MPEEREEQRRDIVESLRRLRSRGADPYWIEHTCQPLVNLWADPEDGVGSSALLVRDRLREAVDLLPSSADRTLLVVVLALDPEYLGLSATQRRVLACEQLAPSGPRSPHTLRQIHELRAIERLADTLVASEQSGVRRQSDDAYSQIQLEGGSRITGLTMSAREVQSVLQEAGAAGEEWVVLERWCGPVAGRGPRQEVVVRARSVVAVYGPASRVSAGVEAGPAVTSNTSSDVTGG